MKTGFINKTKVFIVDEFNSSQTIVKDAYVDEQGNEMPHGEQYIVATSSISDTPLSKWEDVHFKSYKEQYEKDKKAWQREIDDQTRALSLEYDKVYYLTKSVQGMAASLGSDMSMAFIRLLDFMSGRIKYVVYETYSEVKIAPFEDFEKDRMLQQYNHSIEGVKLMTIYGSTRDGKPRGLSYQLSDYRDGSGGIYEIYIFHTEEEAMEKVKEIIQSKTYVNDGIIEQAKKYNVELDKNLLKKFYSDRLSSLEKDITNTKEGLTDKEISRIRTKNILDEL